MDINSDIDEYSQISTSSKSEQISISNLEDQINNLKEFGDSINKNFENYNFVIKDKMMNHEFKKSFKNNFKIKDNLSEFDMDSLDKGLEIEKQDVDSESSISMLSQKTKRQKINCNEDEREEENNNKEKIFSIEKVEKIKKIIYRKDYYIMDFKGNFLNWVLEQLQLLIDNCHLFKKFGKTNFHIANRELYGGNPKEEDNREFISKTIEKVFTLTEEQKNTLTKTSRQIANEKIINKIKEYYEKLLIKKEKDEKYLSQSKAFEKFLKFIKIPIKDALDMYYDSEAFQKFKSNGKIQYYDKMFFHERNRHFSLLEKNNFVHLVNLPYYSEKKKGK